MPPPLPEFTILTESPDFEGPLAPEPFPASCRLPSLGNFSSLPHFQADFSICSVSWCCRQTYTFQSHLPLKGMNLSPNLRLILHWLPASLLYPNSQSAKQACSSATPVSFTHRPHPPPWEPGTLCPFPFLLSHSQSIRESQ